VRERAVGFGNGSVATRASRRLTSDFVILGQSRWSGARCGRQPGELETWNSGDLRGTARHGVGRVGAGPELHRSARVGRTRGAGIAAPWPRRARPLRREHRDFGVSPREYSRLVHCNLVVEPLLTIRVFFFFNPIASSQYGRWNYRFSWLAN
jgi:hypothetical protein